MALRAGDWCAGGSDLAGAAICCRCMTQCVLGEALCPLAACLPRPAPHHRHRHRHWHSDPANRYHSNVSL